MVSWQLVTRLRSPFREKQASSSQFYLYFKAKSLLVLYFKGALKRCFAPL